MNPLIWALKIYIPPSIKNRKLRELAAVTADAFDCATPILRASSYEVNLKDYALFTKMAADRAIDDGQDINSIGQSLYTGAYRMGKDIRATIKPKSPDDIISLISLIYRILHINIKFIGPNKFIINGCFFSKYYSKETCMLISALDKGMVAGISNGWQLDFTQRITEGFDCCKGCLKISADLK